MEDENTDYVTGDSTGTNNPCRKAALDQEAGCPIEDGQDFDPWHPGVMETMGFGKQAPVPPTVLTYKPKTNAHIKAMESIAQGLKAKTVPRDQFGQPKVDCSCMFEKVCQICDGRKGPWVFKGMPNKEDRRFNSYQDGVVRNKMQTMESSDERTDDRTNRSSTGGQEREK